MPRPRRRWSLTRGNRLARLRGKAVCTYFKTRYTFYETRVPRDVSEYLKGLLTRPVCCETASFPNCVFMYNEVACRLDLPLALRKSAGLDYTKKRVINTIRTRPFDSFINYARNEIRRYWNFNSLRPTLRGHCISHANKTLSDTPLHSSVMCVRNSFSNLSFDQ